VYSGKQFNESLRQIAFLLIIVFLACLIIGQLRYFASSILGGFTLYMILRTPHRRMLEKGWGNTLTTTILLVASFIFLVLVLGGLLSVIYSKIKHFHPQLIVNGLHHIHDVIIQKWGYNIFSEDAIQKALAMIGNIIPSIISATGNVLANVVMMMFVLFFMLQQSHEFEQGIEDFLPTSKDSIHLLKKETHNMILSNAVGIPLIMLGQGITAGLAYWILDAGDPIIWGLITGFFGLIPVIGTGGIWLPLAINLTMGGHIWQGIVLIIYGICVVSSVDNVVRIVFLKKKANVHPLITLFGVIIGMNLFGFWGIIFGPLIISGFFLLMKIYKNEFIAK
jgi:predicted PurR-regulated permease PerM